MPCSAGDATFHLAFFTEPNIDDIPVVRVKLLKPEELSLAKKRSLARKLVGVDKAPPLVTAAIEAEQRGAGDKLR